MHIANKRSQSFRHFFASPVPHQRYALHEHRATVILASFSFLVSSAPAASAIHAEVIIGRRVSQHFRRVPSHSYQRGPFFLPFSSRNGVYTKTQLLLSWIAKPHWKWKFELSVQKPLGHLQCRRRSNRCYTHSALLQWEWWAGGAQAMNRDRRTTCQQE